MAAKSTKKEIRLWALVMAAILFVIAGIQYLIWAHTRTATVFWLLCAFFLLFGLIMPGALKPIYKLWLKFAAVLAWVNTRLILGLMFYLVFTPIGLLLRLLRVDLIKQRWDRDASTYWIRRPSKTFDPTNYEKQY